MEKINSVVAVYGTHPQAEEALRAFQSTGFDMKKLSIVGKDYHTEEHVIGFYNAGDRMKFWGKRGAFWGTFWGMLFGSALFLIPGVGHLMVLGPLVGWIVGALGEGAVVGGLTALGAGLYSIGIPKDSILKYETALKADQFVVVAHGTRRRRDPPRSGSSRGRAPFRSTSIAPPARSEPCLRACARARSARHARSWPRSGCRSRGRPRKHDAMKTNTLRRTSSAR